MATDHPKRNQMLTTTAEAVSDVDSLFEQINPEGCWGFVCFVNFRHLSSVFLQTFSSVPFFLFSSGTPITHMFYHLILSPKSLGLCSLVNFFLSILQFQ